MKVIGLFAGIGGIELGFKKQGSESIMLSEILPEAQDILSKNFSSVILNDDVRTVDAIPKVDVMTAGFPCQNLSIAGDKKGLAGEKSVLVHEIFRILENSEAKPDYLVIENVANIISLNKGEVLSLLVDKMTQYGYMWAYRLVDPRSFGIPQRRPRFIFVASKVQHPKYILFPKDEVVDASIEDKPDIAGVDLASAYGFYWTEGKIGIGWALNSIPPLKCGSTLGLPSSPAIWDVKNNFFGTPSVEDAERLQGFPPNWTKFQNVRIKNNLRWKLLGNAVNTRVSEWIAQRVRTAESYEIPESRLSVKARSKWPKAAFSDKGKIFEIQASYYPEGVNYVPILKFLKDPLVPLSLRATLGFYKRVMLSTSIKYPEVFKEALRTYLKEQYSYDA